MHKRFFLLVFILLAGQLLHAQSLMHGIGANMSVVFAKIETPFVKETFTMQVTHLSYFPRYTLTEAENTSISVGSPLGAGVNIMSDGYGSAGLSWGFELPVVLDYNIGCMSYPENEAGFGTYFGAGFSYMYTNYKLYDDENNQVKTYGPVARAGIRFASGGGRWHTTVGLFYKVGMEAQKFKTLGFNVYMDL